MHHHKTRRRRGSLRKVALLGRGAQRDKKESKPLTIDTSHVITSDSESARLVSPIAGVKHDALGLTVSNPVSPSSLHESVNHTTTGTGPSIAMASGPQLKRDGDEQSTSYTSTTDDEDILHIAHASGLSRASTTIPSTSESYFSSRISAPRQRSFQQIKSPLSYSGISTTAVPQPDSDWDYSETERWGWVVLSVTWLVFVIGMGSCLDVWSWAWDVGKTPYAPPELEDDPTLPIVGYYPALIILTCVMAWVWVVVAWVGMKYFRHAKISGD